MMAIVYIVERHGCRGKHIKRGRILDAQLRRDMCCVDEDGFPAFYTIAKTVENLISRWVLKIPIYESKMQLKQNEGRQTAYRRSMCKPRSTLVYAMLRLFLMFLTSHVSP